MTTSIMIVGVLLLVPSAFADDESDRAKLIGRWEQSDGKGEVRSTWALETSADSIRVTNLNRSQTVLQFECNTMGKDCAVEFGGKAATLSMWFNGPKLVEMETRGTRILKRRFCVADGGETLDVEIIPIVPTGKSEIAHFKRVHLVVSKQ
jgi:hypothetical protein